jgi:hypothetical protein
MNTIKNIQKIKELITDNIQLEKGAAMYKRHAGIEFKVLKVENKTITIQTVQHKHFTGKYLTKKELMNRGEELFKRFLPDFTIHIQAIPFTLHPAQAIDTEWVQSEMAKSNLKVKDLVEITGLEKSNISAWVNGKRPMSNIVKSLFYTSLSKH